MKIIWAILIVLVLICIVLHIKRDDEVVPKKIWILWLQGWETAPYIVKKVKDSWSKHNPSYEIIEVSEKNLKQYIDIEDQGYKTPQAYSDIIRLNILEKHGGIWADATMLCMKSIDPLIESLECDTWMYHGRENCKFLASWFIISKQNSYMMKKWKESCDEYWKNKDTADDYFWMDKLWLNLYHNDNTFKTEWDKVEPKICCEDDLQAHALAGKVNETDKNLQELLKKNKPYAIKLSHHDFIENDKETNGNYVINISLN
jgi:hypothetical protein